MKKLIPPLILVVIICYFFKPFIFHHLLPIPADTIIGLYHPYRDLYALTNPNGIVFKNFLITDPVRQQFPWRNLSISIEKMLKLPMWNPYTFSGAPLLANFQSAVFYPLNILLLIFPFSIGWSLLILLQPILSALFLFCYLRKLKVSQIAAIIGAFTFAFSGFSVAWMQWNTLVQVSLWLPLILLASEYLLDTVTPLWVIVAILALVCQIFAGHVQILFYSILVSSFTIIARVIQDTNKKKREYKWSYAGKKILPFIGIAICVAIITSIQWIPTLQFIILSARSVDLDTWKQIGWFIPWQNLIQFIAPDFFGNPATLNYWGIWNYAEFIGYIGIFPLILALTAILERRDKKTLLFSSFFIISLLFALPTGISSLPFILKIPLLSTSQPTRLLVITDFSLSILAAFGWDYLQEKRKAFILPLSLVVLLMSILWIFLLLWKDGSIISHVFPQINLSNITIAKRNLIIPTIFLGIIGIALIGYYFSCSFKNKFISKSLVIILLIVLVIDLFRFADKFLPFSPKQYLFPQTATLSYLENNLGNFRYMTTDSQIFPPNFSVMYHLSTVDGYDPLYLLSYGKLIAASERNKPDIQTPFGFNRIITPHNFASPIMNLLGVRYIISLSDLPSQKYIKVFQEGQTRVYENPYVLARSFFVREVLQLPSEQQVITSLFDPHINLKNTATVTAPSQLMSVHFYSIGSAKIINYSENKVELKTHNNGQGFLVLTDTYYPTWKVSIDGQESKIYITDFSLRGVIVPAGSHTIVFTDHLFY